jgi:hypothetical protein
MRPRRVLAYAVADDKGSGDSLDAAAREELKALCNTAGFGQMNVADRLVEDGGWKGRRRGVQGLSREYARTILDAMMRTSTTWQQNAEATP